ncbi:MepB family protein [Flavobacterium zepuense]|uniref:MepB family protein n=1 Tax=Flavobacterium zepuense TaxID=2593302 RepID=A0A552V5S4_9FLAO|nr:MepB family protein [Flavobacterium zepuense]TRW25824.1 MepB family protein [Flavobacterium zepuense]
MEINALSEPFKTKSLIYDTLGYTFDTLVAEKESQDYSAFTFTLNNLKIVFRSAKITPTKTGQFVTLWKRLSNGPIMPFNALDPIDLVVISVQKNNYYGQFVFPKKVLAAKGVFTTNCKDGKRAIRVYPPWDVTENAQAKRTQKWQLDYFLEVKEGSVTIEKAKLLYGI